MFAVAWSSALVTAQISKQLLNPEVLETFVILQHLTSGISICNLHQH
jgi:hypothetical protein